MAAANTTATYNGGHRLTGSDDEGGNQIPYWSSAAYPVAGSGNSGSRTNAIADCFLVAGCS